MGVYGIILFCNGRWNVIPVLNTVTAAFGLIVFSPTLWAIGRGRKITSDEFGLVLDDTTGAGV